MGGLLFNTVTSTIGIIVGLKAFTAAVVGGSARYQARCSAAWSSSSGVHGHRLHLLHLYQPDRIRALIVVMLVRPSGQLVRAQLQRVSARREHPIPNSPRTSSRSRQAPEGHRSGPTSGWPGRRAGATCRRGWAALSGRASGSAGGPRLAVAGLAAVVLPSLGLGGFQLQVGIDAMVIALLAVGLNIVVGWAGLLDLGYRVLRLWRVRVRAAVLEPARPQRHPPAGQCRCRS